MEEFKILPVLGRKVDVPQDDSSLFRVVGKAVAYTHDVGGINFALNRTRNACSKSPGYTEWSTAATAQKTKCMGLYELYDGTNRNHMYFDNGKFYVYDATEEPDIIEDAGTTTFANSDVDLYSIIKVGAYMVFADRAEHEPQKWKHNDGTLSNLIASGTHYKFRYLVPFQRRVLGLYSKQGNGDIDIRWSTDWPTTAIGSLNFPAANQLWVPNDDPITGGATMGSDKCYIYCEDSIQQFVYVPDYSTPFRIYTIVPGQGFAGHHGIVSLGNRHFGFNKNYGFCEYRGGIEFPFGSPISEDIESDIQGLNVAYYGSMVGTFLPLQNEICWTVYMGTTPDTLLFYNIATKQWRREDKEMRYIDTWQMYDSYSWNDFIAEIGGSGIWSDAGSKRFAYYTSLKQRFVMSNTNGRLYQYSSEGIDDAADFNGYRVEPMLHFGDASRFDLLKEIWFGITYTGDFSIDVRHRSGNTVGETEIASWTSIGSISCNSPHQPVVKCAVNARYHQIEWGTNLKSEKFEVNNIVFKYEPGSQI